mgnify:FL=1
MNILFPILLVIGHLLFIWTASQYLFSHDGEGISVISIMRLVLACGFCLSGLYIFHRQKVISPYMPVKIYTFYTIARIAVAFVCTMIPVVIATAEQIMESVKCKQNCFEFITSTLLELIEAPCVFVFVEGIFSIPWILQHIGLF